MKKLLTVALVAGALLFTASPASARPAPKPNALTRVQVTPLPSTNCRLRTVPNVIGVDVAQASAELVNFSNVLFVKYYGPLGTFGHVVGQNPVGGTTISSCAEVIITYKA